MKSICGIDCGECKSLKRKRCDGCIKTGGSPFGKRCFIADYISVGGIDKYEEFKKELIDEINSIKVDGMKDVDELFALNGDFINLEYPLPSGKKVKLLDDKQIYLGNQVESEYEFDGKRKCFGVVANMDFIFICSYESSGKNAEMVLYKKR